MDRRKRENSLAALPESTRAYAETHRRNVGLKLLVREGSAMYGLLNDAHFVLLVLSCAAVITIGSIVTALHRLPRATFAQLRTALKELSGRVRALEAIEQRRFIRELNSRRDSPEPSFATNGSRPAV
jgi:hypothetical protein